MDVKSMNVKEVSSYSNLSKKTIYNLVNTKKIPFKRISEKKVIFFKDEIDIWLENRNRKRRSKTEITGREKEKNLEEPMVNYKKRRNIYDKLFVNFQNRYMQYFIGISVIFCLGWLSGMICHKYKSYFFGTFPYSTNKKIDDTFDIGHFLNKAKITGLSINQSSEGNDDIDIKLDYISDIELKGDVTSAQIKPFLIYFLENEKDNYATKSRTIDIFRPYLDDQRIRASIINVLKNDESPAIRMKAVSVLTKVAKLKEVKEALLDRLKNDNNEAIRFKALVAIERITDEQITKALKDTIENEKSDVVRKRAEWILKSSSQST